MSSGVAIYEAIDDGRDFAFVDFNQAAERIEGVKKEDLMGKSVVEAFPGVKNSGLFEVFQQVWKTGTPKYFPTSLYEDEKLVVWRENHVYKLPSGEIVAVYDDVTEQMMAAESLQQRTFELGERVKELDCLYQISSFAGKEGISLEELLQGTVDIIPSALRYPEITCIRIILEDLEFSSANYKETAWKLASDISVHNERLGSLEVDYLEEMPEVDEGPFLKEERNLTNAIAGILGRSTERIQAVEALQESEAKYRTLTDNLNVGVYRNTVGPKGEFIEANPAIVKLFGYANREEFLAINTADLYQNPNERKKFNVKMLRDGFVENEELLLKKKDGNPFIASVSAVAVRDENGEVQYYDGIIEDITKRKQLEEERRRLEEQIQEARRMESLGVLAGGIAHDFNNLLTSVLGNADLALMKLSSVSPAYDSVEKIIISARRAADLVSQMLAYAGKGKTIVKPVNLSEVVEEMAHILDASISDNAVVEYDLASDLPMVEADLLQVRQVIRNLFNNSMEALGEDGGSITVTTGAVECGPGLDCIPEPHFGAELREGSYVYLQVDDDGCGMDKEIQEKLFDPFFSTKFVGRGLGLPAALGIVRDHGGAISVRSQPGQGTAARILFPVS